MNSCGARAKGATILLALAAWLWLFGCAGSASGDVVRLLADDEESLRARFELIADAKHSVQAAYYLIDVDPVTYGVLASLRDAARRGVRVQILVDAYRDRMPPPIRSYLLNEGIQIRRYHPMQWTKPTRYVRRLHDKILLKDRDTLIVGGRNVSAQYFGASSEQNFRDCDVLVIGRAASEAAAYFDRLWDSEHVHPAPAWRPTASPQAYHYPTLARRRRMDKTNQLRSLYNAAPRILDEARDALLGPPSVGFHHVTRQRPVGRFVPDVRFLHSSRTPSSSSADITDHLLHLIRSARRVVYIESPYLILSDRFLEALQSVVDRGTPVVIVTNSLASTNHVIAHSGYENQKKQLLKSGIQLWEYQGNEVLHAKCLVIDDCAVVGSYNLHPRSEYYDSEVAVAIEDPVLAATLRASMDERLTAALPVGQQAQQQLGLKGPPREVSDSRYALMQMLRLVAPLVNRHL